jgi:SagB-type dehydrogenase family enzyme
MNYATGAFVRADPLASDVLDFFDRWRTIDRLVARHPSHSLSELRTMVNVLARRSLLVRRSSKENLRIANMEAWDGWNPAAGFFHMVTKDVPYVLDRAAERASRARTQGMPPPFKRYSGARTYPLPAVQTEDSFASVLRARRTWRRFSSRPLQLDDLGTLLGLTFGVQGWFQVSGGRAPFKTSPSGGARHPIEAYVLVKNVKGLNRGAYHYAADRHVLERLGAASRMGPVSRYLPTQSWFNSAAALIFMTAIFPRTQWRYGFARAYRVVLAEAGHLCQTFCLAATRLSLAPFCSMALADSRIEQDLDLDGISESVLYAAGVGTRPRNGDIPGLQD